MASPRPLPSPFRSLHHQASRSCFRSPTYNFHEYRSSRMGRRADCHRSVSSSNVSPTRSSLPREARIGPLPLQNTRLHQALSPPRPPTAGHSPPWPAPLFPKFHAYRPLPSTTNPRPVPRHILLRTRLSTSRGRTQVLPRRVSRTSDTAFSRASSQQKLGHSRRCRVTPLHDLHQIPFGFSAHSPQHPVPRSLAQNPVWALRLGLAQARALGHRFGGQPRGCRTLWRAIHHGAASCRWEIPVRGREKGRVFKQSRQRGSCALPKDTGRCRRWRRPGRSLLRLSQPHYQTSRPHTTRCLLRRIFLRTIHLIHRAWG